MAGMNTSKGKFWNSVIQKSKKDKKFQISTWSSNSCGTSCLTWWAHYASFATLDLDMEISLSCQTWWKCLSCLSGSEVLFTMHLTCDSKLPTSKSVSGESKTTWLKMKWISNKSLALMINLLQANMLSRLTIRASVGVCKLSILMRCSTGWTKNLKVSLTRKSLKNN
jgi:hypothetical protein